MQYRPHDYQTYATNFILEHPVAAVFLQMGLGKSVITLTALHELILNRFEVRRALVIAPLRVARDTWPEEIGKWDGSHKKLAGFAGMINSFTDTRITKYSSLLSFSKDLYTLLVKEGYTGSERTVRNYLSRQKKVSIYFDSLKHKGVQYAESNKHC